MSLLMQALKKAERSKQNSLLEEEPQDKPSEAYDEVLSLAPQETPPRPAAPREFSLEPLEPLKLPDPLDPLDPLDPPARAASGRQPDARPFDALRLEAAPGLTPAEEAPHDPTPPQSRLGASHPAAAQSPPSPQAAQTGQDMPLEAQGAQAGGGMRTEPAMHAAPQDGAAAPAGRTDARSADRRHGGGQRSADPAHLAAGHAGRHGRSAGDPASGPGAGARTRAATAARAAAAQDKIGTDPARVRLAVLSGMLVLILALFGYLYWRATSSPGPGAALPMVPMPPPDSNGARAGVIVAPPGPFASPAAGGAEMAPDAAPEGTPLADAARREARSTPFAIASPDRETRRAAAGTAGAGLAAAPAYSAPPRPQSAAPAASSASPGSMLGSARTPASATVMATPEEIEQAMQMQAGRQGTPPPFIAAQAMDQPAGKLGGANAADMAGAAASSPASASSAWPAPSTSTSTPSAPPSGRGGDAAWPSSDIRVSRNSAAPRLDPALQGGYQALLAGDLQAAGERYASALRQEPNSRDALLGSAAVAVRRNDMAHAAASYMRLLELNPSDPDALAGLLSLRPGDTGQAELRLKDMLRKTPDAGTVLFALGNLYARQARWSDAQQAFFRAYTASPDNPDYAFNLAVGLDRLNQPRLALNYYQRALSLAQASPAGFDSEAVRARMRQLAAPN